MTDFVHASGLATSPIVSFSVQTD